MTPGARVQAAIEVLGAVAGGAPAERELTSWGRRSRYAGSKDRAAVRDHVYDALRRLRSSAWLGGLGDVAGLDAVAEPARVLAGSIRGSGGDPAALFTGQGHAPPPIDLPVAPGPMPDGVAADLPDWALARLRADHGDRANAIAAALRDRAPVVLRANLARTSRGALLAELSEMGHAAAAHPMSPTAIRLEGNPRGLAASAPFLAGHFEFQ
ncbi:MAG: RsmB/NOP family class I SAM-dependent RNA methyltransferase, partial [Pseudomonadota bacterium]